MRKLTAEALGTFILVFGGTGAAVFAAKFPATGIGFAGVALAFGLTVLAGVYALGPISGAHFNPAVTIGLACARRFAWRDVPSYIAVQLFGAVLGSAAVLILAHGAPGGYDVHVAGLAANGYGAHSPGGYSMPAALLAEVILTFVFLTVILGATSRSASTTQAGIAVGLTLTLVHLIGIPITNTSVNPARSTAPALFVGGWALAQLWLFWLAPLSGAAIAGWLARPLHAEEKQALRARGEIPGSPMPGPAPVAP